MKKETTYKVRPITLHRGLSIFALCGLFVCGLVVGLTWTSHKGGDNLKQIAMTNEQCEKIAGQIVSVARGDWGVNNGKTTGEVNEQLRQLNDVYNKNCAGRVIPVVDKPAEKVPVKDTSDKETCAVIEDMLLENIVPETERDISMHEYNIETYKRLLKHGCEKNTDKYNALIQREQDIIRAIEPGTAASDEQTCAEIERVLLREVPDAYNDSDNRIERAKKYAVLSERGCPENSQHYVELASRELEIARALRDDKFDNRETEEVVETYKRLEMKQTATEVLNKVQKLTDPAIDFIIQMQKIIEE